VHERVDVVVLAVELPRLAGEVDAHAGHDLLAAGEDRVGERVTPVPGGEDQMVVEVVHDRAASVNVRIWGSSG
jgi:hypothetical protein